MKQSDIEKNNRNISSMYRDWFLDYASYVILERAIPDINDGLKPVQKRILHSSSPSSQSLTLTSLSKGTSIFSKLA